MPCRSNAQLGTIVVATSDRNILFYDSAALTVQRVLVGYVSLRRYRYNYTRARVCVACGYVGGVSECVFVTRNISSYARTAL